jgi:hypothetical protein
MKRIYLRYAGRVTRNEAEVELEVEFEKLKLRFGNPKYEIVGG